MTNGCLATALLFGLLSYFLLIPGFSVDSGSAIWSSSLALFVALDCYIILRLWHLRDSADSKEYRFRYTWALLGVIIWGLGDLFWLLMYENILNDSSSSGTLFDLIWPIGICAIGVATRPNETDPDTDIQTAAEHESIGIGPLVFYAILPLMLHVALYRFGNPGASLEMAK